MSDTWSIGAHAFTSRLLVGTGKYPDFPTMQRALVASGAEVVTVAVRRLDLTKKGAESLLEWIPKGMKLLPNTADDPVTAKKLEDAGCAAVMPLGAPIGSGLGIRNPYNLRIIMETVKVPVLVDAGVGTASDAAIAMELGAVAVLMNTAIAEAKDPVLMAEAMRAGVEAGRKSWLAGRIPMKLHASASSPRTGLLGTEPESDI